MQGISACTASSRWTREEGASSCSLRKLEINLKPYPRQVMNTMSWLGFDRQMSTGEIAVQALRGQNRSVANTSNSMMITGALQLRGDTEYIQVAPGVHVMAQSRSFQTPDWQPKCFPKIGLCRKAPTFHADTQLKRVPRTGCFLSMNGAIMESAISPLCHQFDLLYSKRAWVHFYMNGNFEEDMFMNAREGLHSFSADCEQIITPPCREDDEDAGYEY